MPRSASSSDERRWANSMRSRWTTATDCGTAARSWSARVTVTVSASGAIASRRSAAETAPGSTCTKAISLLKPGSTPRT